jgi:hypothetical protein
MKSRSSLGSTAPGSTAPGASQQNSASLMPPIQIEAVMAAQLRVFERIGSINRIWLESVREANKAASDLAARLAQCGNAAESAGLCNEWVQERAARFTSDTQKAAELWLGLYASAIAEPDDAADAYGKGEHPGAGHEKQQSSKAA